MVSSCSGWKRQRHPVGEQRGKLRTLRSRKEPKSKRRKRHWQAKKATNESSRSPHTGHSESVVSQPYGEPPRSLQHAFPHTGLPMAGCLACTTTSPRPHRPPQRYHTWPKFNVVLTVEDRPCLPPVRTHLLTILRPMVVSITKACPSLRCAR